jgi:hypothetical protein
MVYKGLPIKGNDRNPGYGLFVFGHGVVMFVKALI